MIHGSSNQIKVQNMVIENALSQDKKLRRETEEIEEDYQRQHETVNYHIDRVEAELNKLIDIESKNQMELES